VVVGGWGGCVLCWGVVGLVVVCVVGLFVCVVVCVCGGDTNV